MAKSETVTVKGIANWAKVFEDNREMFEFNEETGAFDKPSETKGKYTINVTLEPDEFKKLKRTGSLACRFAKEDEAGLDVVKFSRPQEKKGQGGKVLDFASGSPNIFTATGSKWSFENDGPILNGSEVEVTVVVYQTKFSPGTRLETVTVLRPAEPVEREKEDEIPF